MPATVALILWFILLMALLHFDPAREPGTSFALWVPVIWMFIVGSRLPSQWFGVVQAGLASAAFEEGNPVDRVIFLIFILLAVVILISRSFQWGQFFARNLILMVFLSFALLSVFWSDFPFVAFKRWIRDLGNYLMILLVLTDPRPMEAVRSLLRRFIYLIIPLCILLFKYYPQIGMQYDVWVGAEELVGATTSKNMLGVVCLVSGIYLFWDTLTQWSNRKEWRIRRTIAINVAFFIMTLWLLYRADSATSRVCLLIGCMVIAAAHTERGRRHPGLLRFLIPSCFGIYVVLAFGFGLMGSLAKAVGRNPTLTDRTIIWQILLNMNTNPFVGTGYESFWLGPRLQWVWQQYSAINEAHNGYLEIYLSLGGIGLFLLGGLLVATYRTIGRRLKSLSSIGSLFLALWTIQLFYNVTEAAFRFHLMWFTFLLGAIALPEKAEDRLCETAALDTKQGFGAKSEVRKPAPEIPPKQTGQVPIRSRQPHVSPFGRTD
jgi:exopolysaccharide production protein ExoQ